MLSAPLVTFSFGVKLNKKHGWKTVWQTGNKWVLKIEGHIKFWNEFIENTCNWKALILHYVETWTVDSQCFNHMNVTWPSFCFSIAWQSVIFSWIACFHSSCTSPSLIKDRDVCMNRKTLLFEDQPFPILSLASETNHTSSYPAVVIKKKWFRMLHFRAADLFQSYTMNWKCVALLLFSVELNTRWKIFLTNLSIFCWFQVLLISIKNWTWKATFNG